MVHFIRLLQLLSYLSELSHEVIDKYGAELHI